MTQTAREAAYQARAAALEEGCTLDVANFEARVAFEKAREKKSKDQEARHEQIAR